MIRRFTGAIAILGLAFTLSACKQGEGERCQIDDDCEDGLECNASTMECQRVGGGTTIDAAPTPDAPPAVDSAPTPDAPAAADADTTDADTADAS